MSLVCVSQGPGAVCIPENQGTSACCFQGFRGCPAAPGFPSSGTCWVCFVRCQQPSQSQQSARLRGGFAVALLKASQDHFSCCSFRLGSFVHSGGKFLTLRQQLLALPGASSRCSPRATNPPCTCAQVPVPLLSTWAGSLSALHILRKVTSWSRAQEINLKSYFQALALIPRTVPI